jgi:hypothetical protein
LRIDESEGDKNVRGARVGSDSNLRPVHGEHSVDCRLVRVEVDFGDGVGVGVGVGVRVGAGVSVRVGVGVGV